MRLSGLLAVVLCASTASAVPVELTHTGRVIDNVTGLPIDGQHDITVTLFDAQTGGSQVWTETTNIGFDDGYFSVPMGASSSNGIDDSALDQTLWVEIAIDGGSPVPRQLIRSVPYARLAGVATDLNGGVVDATEIRVNGNVVIDDTGTITSGVGTSLDDLGCITDQVPLYDGTNWGCAAANQSGSVTWSDVGNKPAGFDDDVDDDTLAALTCAADQIARWNGVSVRWECADDAVLTEADVISFATNGGFVLDSSLATIATSGLWDDLQNVPPDFADGVDDMRTDPDIVSVVTTAGFALDADIAIVGKSGDYADLINVPNPAQVGGVAPVCGGAEAGQFWLDTSAAITVTNICDGSAWVPVSMPGPVTPLNLTATTTGSTSIDLDWDDAAYSLTYRVFQNPDDSTFTEIANVHGTDFTVGGLSPDTQYYFRVAGSNFSGDSPQSASADDTTLSGTFGAAVDGNLSFSGTFDIVAEVGGSTRSGTAPDGVAYRVIANPTATVTLSGGASGFAAGDKALLINVQGSEGDNADAGNYEIVDIAGASGNQVTLTALPANSYDGTVFSNQKVVLQRIPQYNDVTIDNADVLTASPWDGLQDQGSGRVHTGIVAFMVSGTLALDSAVPIDVSQRGFRGGVVGGQGPEDALDDDITSGGTAGGDSSGAGHNITGGAGGMGPAGAGSGGDGGDSNSSTTTGGTGNHGGGGGAGDYSNPGSGGGGAYDSGGNYSSPTSLSLGGGAAQGGGGGTSELGTGGQPNGLGGTGGIVPGGNGGAGGAGGGLVHILAASVVGNGVIDAGGGVGGSGGGGSAGGHKDGGGGGGGGANGAAGGTIVVLYGSSSWSETTNVAGGAGGGGGGGAGVPNQHGVSASGGGGGGAGIGGGGGGGTQDSNVGCRGGDAGQAGGCSSGGAVNGGGGGCTGTCNGSGGAANQGGRSSNTSCNEGGAASGLDGGAGGRATQSCGADGNQAAGGGGGGAGAQGATGFVLIGPN